MTPPRPRRIVRFRDLPLQGLFRWDYTGVPSWPRIGVSNGPFRKETADRFSDVNDEHGKRMACHPEVRVVPVVDRVDREAAALVGARKEGTA